MVDLVAGDAAHLDVLGLGERGDLVEDVGPARVGGDPDVVDLPGVGDEELTHRAPAFDLLREVARATPAHRCQIVPPGVSSSWMPRAVSSSRNASAVAKSFAARRFVASAHEVVDLGVVVGA